MFEERLKRSQAVEETLINEEEAEMPSEQLTLAPNRTSSEQGDSESAVWVPSDLDSDEGELEMNEEEAGSSLVQEKTTPHDAAEETKQNDSLSSKKGRKRKRLARVSAMVKKQKLVCFFFFNEKGGRSERWLPIVSLINGMAD